MSKKIAARIDDQLYDVIMKMPGKNFTEKLENAIKSNVSDNKECMSDKYDYISKINFLKSELSKRISIFDDSYTYTQLGSFLYDTEFIAKFHQDIRNYWGENNDLQALLNRLKKVYDEAFENEKEIEKDLFGCIKSVKDEFRYDSTLKSIPEYNKIGY